jgi:hypothetical protein
MKCELWSKASAGAGAQAAAEEILGEPTPRNYGTRFYRRCPEFIFNETQRYSFIECLSFFIQLLPALLQPAYDEYPVIDD